MGIFEDDDAEVIQEKLLVLSFVFGVCVWGGFVDEVQFEVLEFVACGISASPRRAGAQRNVYRPPKASG